MASSVHMCSVRNTLYPLSSALVVSEFCYCRSCAHSVVEIVVSPLSCCFAVYAPSGASAEFEPLCSNLLQKSAQFTQLQLNKAEFTD